MKRKYIIIIAVTLIAVFALFSLRHIIVGHVFKITISKKTNKTITLNVGQVHYSIFKSSVSFTDSKLAFNNTYLNKDETVELSELNFDEIRLEGLSVFHLIFNREVIATKFTVSKPSLWFSEDNNPMPFKERPKEIIEHLKKHPGLLGNLTIIVDEIEITNGMIDLKSLIDNEEYSGSLKFKLLLKNFDTSKESVFEEDRVLFAEEHFVELSDFNYTLPNGDQISFDSVVFGSHSNRLITSNIKIVINSGSLDDKYNPVTAQIREVLIEGIDFESIEEMHDIVIDNISISDVYLDIIKNDSVFPKVVSDSLSKKNNLFKVMKSLSLSSFALNNVNVLNRDSSGDTIIDVENVNFIVKEIVLDSASFANKNPDIDFGSISLSTGVLKMIEKKSGLKINLDELLFTEIDGVVSLSGLQIDDSGIAGSNKFKGNVDSVELSGVFVEQLVNGNQMKIGVLLSNPDIDFDLSNGKHKKREKGNFDFGKFEISDIQISNGLIHLSERDKLDLSVKGVNLNTGSIQLKDLTKIHEISTYGITLNTSDLQIHMPEKDIMLISKSISFLNNALTINDISWNYKELDKINSSLFISQLQLGGTNISKLISDKEIDLKFIRILRPRLGGSLNLFSDKGSSTSRKPVPKFDYKVNIDDFELVNGNIDLSLVLQQDMIRVKTDIDMIIDEINIGDNNDTTWINDLLWKVNLSQSVIDYQDYLINCKNIELDNDKQVLLIKGVEVAGSESSRLKSGIDIRDLSIEKVNLVGLEYNTIIDKKTPVVKSISVLNPYFDIKIDNRSHTKRTTDQKTPGKLPFEIDEFEMNNLSFTVEKQDSVSISNFSLSKLNVKYDLTSTDNLVDGLDYLDAGNFQFSDTIKNSFADVRGLSYNKDDLAINIDGIRGGSIKKLLGDEPYLVYASSGTEISNIDISVESPHNVSVRGVNIDDLKLDIEDHKVKNVASSSSKKQLKLPSFLNSFSIDELSGRSIDVIHSSVTDTTSKELVLNNLEFLISSFKVDSVSLNDNNYEFAKHVSVSLKDNKFITSDSLYATSINNISYDFTKNILEVDSLLLKPRYEPAEFFKKAVYQTGKMDVVAGRIVCSDVRLKKIIRDGSIHMGGVDVYGLDMRIFRNKKYEMNPNLFKKMPQEALLDVQKVITIDSLKTHDAYIQYRQLSKKSIVPGEIFLNEANLSAFNISNDLKVIDQTSAMLVFFDAKLIGESALNIKMTLPILTPSHDFWVTGHVDEVDFTKLNSMTQNLVGVTMARGTGELDIPLITGNSVSAEGSILFKYKKLKIELYDRDKAENASGLGGSMANLLLNDIFVKSNNPGFLGKTKEGEVYFKRNTQKSIVFYTWKSILSGLMSTMGYNNKEQRQEKRALRNKSR